ncbi:D-hexose-6-phosphate mutarotase [Bifidobacterium breve]|uniref:D-hexose-6-phosphate mutarotase n=1 Tax=Bifidobacterium breve TaxID=1685 RepID=UPI000E36DF5A|nr:D-hexose-6-phosphate mutarotase [Bifidobacterium breve]RDX29689.1 D-hexose-6-phosphate mutarotase [Bifidobacterium breve]
MSDTFVIREFNGDDSRLEISDYGAQVLSWAPVGQPSVIWRPSALVLEAGVPIRGGVPVVTPWFGAGYASGHALGLSPKHGSARLSFWHCEDPSDSSDGRVRYRLDLPADAADPSGQPLRAVYEVGAGGSLRMTLTVANVGEASASVEMALHTYLRVGDVRRTRVRGLSGVGYWDAAAGGVDRVQQEEDIAFADEVDRVYGVARPLEVHDPVLNRVIHVRSDGAEQTVVWNPGERIGDAITDMAPGEWSSFVCVEAALCRGHAVELAPGESCTLGQTLSL